MKRAKKNIKREVKKKRKTGQKSKERKKRQYCMYYWILSYHLLSHTPYCIQETQATSTTITTTINIQEQHRLRTLFGTILLHH